MKTTPHIAFLAGASFLTSISPVFAFADEKPAVTLPEVLVTEQEAKKAGPYNSKVINLPKYPGALLDTPQTTNVVPAQLMQDQGASTLRNVLQNVSGISLAAGEGGAQGDSLTIRGFTARTDIFLDGTRNTGNYYRDPFNLEEVEVLKGSASMNFGRGSTGGVVNQESKAPKLDEVTNLSLTGGSDNTKRATADINRKASDLGDNTYFRLNMMSHSNNVAGRDAAENKRFGFAPSLGLGLGTSNRYIFSYYKQVNQDLPDYGIPFLFQEAAPVARTNYYGFRNGGNFLNTDVDIFTVRNERELSDVNSLRQQLRYGTYGRNAQITEAKVPTSVTPGTDINSITVTRNQLAAQSRETSLNYDVQLTTRLENHTLISGIEAARETSDPTRYTFTGVPSTSLVNPSDIAFTGTGAVNTKTDLSIATLSAFFGDTMKLGEKWELTLGARYDYLESKSEQTRPTIIKLSRVDNIPSWRAGLVYKPVPNGSIYLNYGTSFNPSVELLSLSTANANLAPEKNNIAELGSKWNLADGEFTLNTALFWDEKTDARTPDPNDPTVNVLAGNQRVKGGEVEVSGEIAKNWTLFAGMTYLESEITESNNPLELGKEIPNTPSRTYSLWTTYQLTGKLQVAGGVRGVSTRLASNTPDVATGLLKYVPGYHVLDAMLGYQMSKQTGVQLNFYNLDDKFYVDGLHSGHLVVGPGRSVAATLNLSF